jgi:hypothetical protein
LWRRYSAFWGIFIYSRDLGAQEASGATLDFMYIAFLFVIAVSLDDWA